jgi:Mn-dependent DtxR family transcriptional regulator
MRILRICRGESHTNKEIADALGKDPGTTFHHVRRLVDTGFLTAQPVRRGVRGSRETPYLSTGKSWTLDVAAKDRVLVDTFLEELALVPVDSVHTTRLGLRLAPGARAEFEDRLQSLFDEYAALPHQPDGESWSVFVAVHPDPNQPGNRGG